MKLDKMSSVLVPLVALTLALTLALVVFPANGGGVPGPKAVRVDSAFVVNDLIVLVSGYDTVGIMVENGIEDELKDDNLGQFDFDEGSKFGASWATTSKNNTQAAVLFYAQDKGYYLNLTAKGGPKLRPFKYGWRRDFIYHFGAPDAAVRHSGGTVFFKGCKMALRHRYNQWEEETDVPAGLPCNIDAAWKSEHNDGIARLLKGNQVYFWYPNNTVSEAIDFDSLYSLRSWTLLPADESFDG